MWVLNKKCTNVLQLYCPVSDKAILSGTEVFILKQLGLDGVIDKRLGPILTGSWPK